MNDLEPILCIHYGNLCYVCVFAKDCILKKFFIALGIEYKDVEESNN